MNNQILIFLKILEIMNSKLNYHQNKPCPRKNPAKIDGPPASMKNF